MQPEEFLKKMEELREEFKDDPEACHSAMDMQMCICLCTLGYAEGVKIFENLEKWYA